MSEPRFLDLQRNQWELISGIYIRWVREKSLGAGILFFIWNPHSWDDRGE